MSQAESTTRTVDNIISDLRAATTEEESTKLEDELIGRIRSLFDFDDAAAVRFLEDLKMNWVWGR